MKKIIGILSIFLGFGFVVCVILGFIIPINVEITESKNFIYKFLCGIEYFLSYLPAVVFTGYVISCSVSFGHNAEGSTERFSEAMWNRFKIVIISALICTSLLTISKEIILTSVQGVKYNIVNQPKIINEYLNMGNQLLEEGSYKRALKYSNAVLKLDKDNEEAKSIQDTANIEINRASASDIRFRLNESEVKLNAQSVEHINIDEKSISDVYECYQKAQDAFNKGQWFNAHYYAELGISLSTQKDPNLVELRNLSTSAWNNITALYNDAKSEQQVLFAQKYKGYEALVKNNDLEAYYIFWNLYNSSEEMKSDSEVVFYLNVAEQRLTEKYFFIDETFEMQSFESANNVHFSYEYKDGSMDVVYFKGMTSVKSTGGAIQYLRGLNVVSYDVDKVNFRKMEVAYAKVLPVSVQMFTKETKDLLGIEEDTEYVPYIMLKSISRDSNEDITGPVYTYLNEEIPSRYSHPQDYIMLPISYDDFLMLEASINNPDVISIPSLWKLAPKISKYGFSNEIFFQALFNRLLYPFWILVVFISLASFGWNNKIGITQYFKFSWIFSFPFMILIGFVLSIIVDFVLKLFNSFILSVTGPTYFGLIFGIILNLVLIILLSIYFLARKSN